MLADLPASLVAELGNLPASELKAILGAFAAHDRQKIELSLEGTDRDHLMPGHSAWMNCLIEEAVAVAAGNGGRMTRAAAEALIPTDGSTAAVPPVRDRRAAGPSLFEGIRNAMPLGGKRR